jgi:hypothetical protein
LTSLTRRVFDRVAALVTISTFFLIYEGERRPCYAWLLIKKPPIHVLG